jgi:hypothetical protein
MKNHSLLACLLMPYLTVAFGLYVCRNAWVAVFGYHIGIILFLSQAGPKNAARHFRSSASIGRAMLFGLGGLSAGAALYLLWPVLHFSLQLPSVLLDWGLNPQSWPWFIAYGALVNPWLEEAYWRHGLGSAARHPILNDAAFAGFHLVILAPFLALPWLLVVFLVLSFAGWSWRQVTRIEASLLAAALFHMAADVSILLVIVSEIT